MFDIVCASFYHPDAYRWTGLCLHCRWSALLVLSKYFVEHSTRSLPAACLCKNISLQLVLKVISSCLPNDSTNDLLNDNCFVAGTPSRMSVYSEHLFEFAVEVLEFWAHGKLQLVLLKTLYRYSKRACTECTLVLHLFCLSFQATNPSGSQKHTLPAAPYVSEARRIKVSMTF